MSLKHSSESIHSHTIPPELFREIVRYDDRETLRSLRLTSIWLLSLATPPLFENIYLGQSLESVEKALSLISHPTSRVKEHVKTLHHEDGIAEWLRLALALTTPQKIPEVRMISQQWSLAGAGYTSLTPEIWNDSVLE